MAGGSVYRGQVGKISSRFEALGLLFVVLRQSALRNIKRLLSSALSATIDECLPIELLTADCRIYTYFGKGNLVPVQDRRKSFEFVSGRLSDLESAGP